MKELLNELEENCTKYFVAKNTFFFSLENVIRKYCNENKVDFIDIESLNFNVVWSDRDIVLKSIGFDKCINRNKLVVYDTNDKMYYLFELPFYAHNKLSMKLIEMIK